MIRVAALLFFSITVEWSFALQTGDAQTLQQRGIQRIESFIRQVRRTGDARAAMPDLQQAEAELSAAYPRFTARNDWAAAALTSLKLGDIQRLQSKWDEATALYTRAREQARKANRSDYLAKALIGLARTDLLGRKNPAAAAAAMDEALRLSPDLDPTHLFEALDMAAQVEVARGRLVMAGTYLNRALALEDKVQDQAQLFFAYLDRADVYLKRAEKCDYERSFEPCKEALKLARSDYDRALALAQKLGFTFFANQVRNFQRELDMRAGMIESQEKSHRTFADTTGSTFRPNQARDVTVSERFTSPPDEGMAAQIQLILQLDPSLTARGDARSLYIRGLSQEMMGNNTEALTAYIKAAELLDRDRRQLRDEESRGTFLEDKIGIYYAAMLQLLQKGRVDEAFDVIERSRSRAMADLLASRELGLPRVKERTLLADSLQARAKIALAQQDLFDLRARGGRDQHAERVAALEAKIARLEGDLQNLTARMSQESPRMKDLVESQPVSLQKAQHSARQQGYDLLYYIVLEHAVIVWHINGDGAHVRNVFLPRSQVISKVTALHDSLIGREKNQQQTFDRRTSKELFLYLIEPVRKWIRTNHLVIVAHEDLNYLPFQVLESPAGEYLGERFEVSYAPSATILAGLSKKPNLAGLRLLAAADPSMGEAAKEIQAIGRLYPASSRLLGNVLPRKNEIKDLAGAYDVLHFSVHGVFDNKEPLLSFLAFRKTAEDDGRLTAAEMFGLPLVKDSLVVLSACESGRVEATHANELLGMVRALLYAGANNLVLSSWKVDPAATALWMETFYREAQGNPLSESARRALLAVKQRPEYQHPYFWGPFLLIGK